MVKLPFEMRGAVAAMALFALAVPAGASTITAISATADTGFSLPPFSTAFDSETAASGSVTADATDFDNQASAFADDTGVMTANVNAFVANGEVANFATGFSSITHELTNTSGAEQNLFFDYNLTGMVLDVNGDQGGSGAGPNPILDRTSPSVGAFLQFNILVDGTVVETFRADLWGANGAYQNTVTSNLSATLLGQSSEFDFGFVQGERLELADVSGTLNLGTLVAGASKNVTTTATVGYVTNGFEAAAFGNFGDPNGVASAGLRTTPVTGGPSVIPLPASAWLMIAGLGGIAAVRRARKAA